MWSTMFNKKTNKHIRVQTIVLLSKIVEGWWCGLALEPHYSVTQKLFSWLWTPLRLKIHPNWAIYVIIQNREANGYPVSVAWFLPAPQLYYLQPFFSSRHFLNLFFQGHVLDTFRWTNFVCFCFFLVLTSVLGSLLPIWAGSFCLCARWCTFKRGTDIVECFSLCPCPWLSPTAVTLPTLWTLTHFVIKTIFFLYLRLSASESAPPKKWQN